MVRRLIAGVALVSALLFGVAIAAWAAPGDSDSSSSSGQTIEVSGTAASYQSIQVSGTSSAITVQSTSHSQATKTEFIQVLPTSSTKSNLSYTGVSFNVPLTIAIAAIIVLLGAGLVFLGTRGISRARRQH